VKKYNIIFLRSDKMLLSRKQYSHWKEIQDDYTDYMASLDFETLNDVVEYITLDYKLSIDRVSQEVNKINESAEFTTEIKI